jgi:hypothetical protein
MKIFVLPIFAVSLLAACATPQERCVSSAKRDYNAIQQRVNKVQSDIARGYAVHKTREPFTVMGTCVNKNKEYYSCPRTDYRVVEKPVSLDIAQERVKLKDLENRASIAYDRMIDQVSQCRYIHPE